MPRKITLLTERMEAEQPRKVILRGMPREIPKTFLLLALLALLAANSLAGNVILSSLYTRFTVLSAGKGAAALLKARGGEIILIDTGSDAGILRALGTALPPWRRRINAIVLTGAPAAGLAAILGRYEVGDILRFGTQEMPYGARLRIDDTVLKINGPGNFKFAAFSDSY